MSSARRARTIDFRRWYERRLYESFAWLTTCLLSGVLIAAILEFIGLRTPGLTPLLTLALVYLVGLLAVTAFARFWTVLSHAQACANGATCAGCGAYGRFDVVVDADHMPAECHRCGHRWTIE